MAVLRRAREAERSEPEVPRRGARGTPKGSPRYPEGEPEVPRRGARGTPKGSPRYPEGEPEVPRRGARGTPKGGGSGWGRGAFVVVLAGRIHRREDLAGERVARSGVIEQLVEAADVDPVSHAIVSWMVANPFEQSGSVDESSATEGDDAFVKFVRVDETGGIQRLGDIFGDIKRDSLS